MKLHEIVPWKWGKKEEHSLPDIFDSFWNDPFGINSLSRGTEYNSPKVEVSEHAKDLTVSVEAPGMDENAISVDYYNGALRIRGEKHSKKEKKGKKFHYSECSYGSFTRIVPLPKEVQWKNARAKYKRGVLKITLPKVEEKEHSNRIEITVK